MQTRLGVIFVPLLALFISSCPPPAARELTWGVLDVTTNASNTVASGGKHLAVWGDGSFTCNDSDNAQFPNQLPAGISKKEASPGNVQSFITTDEFVYIRLSCGRHSFPVREFTVTNGTLHIHGEETSLPGTITTATLDLTR